MIDKCDSCGKYFDWSEYGTEIPTDWLDVGHKRVDLSGGVVTGVNVEIQIRLRSQKGDICKKCLMHVTNRGLPLMRSARIGGNVNGSYLHTRTQGPGDRRVASR